MFKTKSGIYLTLAALFLIPVVLLILPKAFFNEGIVICPSMFFLEQECPGCGITRGIMHLIHLDFESAVYYNPLSFIVLPVMIGVWVYCVRKLVRDLKS